MNKKEIITILKNENKIVMNITNKNINEYTELRNYKQMKKK